VVVSLKKVCEQKGRSLPLLTLCVLMAFVLASALADVASEPVPPASLYVESAPAGASVWIASELQGQTPLTITLAPGAWQVAVSKRGYRDRTLPLTVSAGQDERVSVALSVPSVAERMQALLLIHQALHRQVLPETRRLLEQALELDPDNAVAWNELARTYMGAEGDLPLAIYALRRSLALDPAGRAACMNLALCYARQKRWEGAADYAGQVLKQDGADPDALALLAESCRQMARWDQAADACRRLILLQPREAVPHYRAAVCLQEASRLEDASAQYEEVIQLAAPTDDLFVLACMRLADCRRQMKDWDGVIKACNQAFGARPSYAAAAGWIALAYACKGDADQAGKWFETAASANPQWAWLWHRYGLFCLQQGRAADALESLRRALQLEPDGADIALDLAAALESVGRDDEAAATLNRALEHHDGASLLLTNLVALLGRSGRYAQACAILERCKGVLEHVTMVPGGASFYETESTALRGEWMHAMIEAGDIWGARQLGALAPQTGESK